MSGTSKELRAVALKNLLFLFFKVWKFSSHYRGESAFIFIQSYLITSKTHMLETIFPGAEYFNEQEYMYVQVMIRELNLHIFYPAQA